MNMNTGIPKAATSAMKSVVLFSSRGCADYCSGFIVVKSRTYYAGTSPKTLVVAPLDFVRGKKYLSVCFFDGVKLEATLMGEEKSFSLLRTEAHSECHTVRLMEESKPSPFASRPTFVLPPLSAGQMYYQRAYATLESLESYLQDSSCLGGSKNYFLIRCDYLERMNSGLTRLAASPVFIIDDPTTQHSGLAMGFVLQDTNIDNDRMKVAVTSTYFKKVLKKLDPSPPPPRKSRKPRKQERLYGGKPFLSVPQKRGRGGSSGQKRKRVN